MALTEEEYQKQQQQLEEQIAQQQDAYNTVYDQLNADVEKYKAETETPEQREARARDEKNAAMFSGIADGIGSIFNLVNAANNPDAVSVAAPPVSNAVKASMDEGARKRALADDKLRAAQDRLNNVGLQRAQANSSMLRDRLGRLRDEYKYGKEDAYRQASEQRQQDLHPYQTQAAQANAQTAQTAAAHAEENAQLDMQGKRARNKQYAAQAASAQLQNKSAQDLDNYWKEHPDEYRQYIENVAKAGASKGNKNNTASGEDFTIMVGNDPNHVLNLGNVSREDIAAIIDSDVTLTKVVNDAIDAASTGRGSNKKRPDEKEQDMIRRRVLASTLTNNPDIFGDALGAIETRLGMTPAGNKPKGDAPYLKK